MSLQVSQLPEMKPAAHLNVSILGDEATVEVSVDAGATLPEGMLHTAVQLVQTLAEKRLAWWNPIE